MNAKAEYLKILRDKQRRFLRKRGWKAVDAMKDNGSFQWKWIHAKYKRAFSRQAAVRTTLRWINND